MFTEFEKVHRIFKFHPFWKIVSILENNHEFWESSSNQGEEEKKGEKKENKNKKGKVEIRKEWEEIANHVKPGGLVVGC